MTRHTTFRFTLQPTAGQEQVLWRHAGAARFAFNKSLSLVKDALEAKKTAPETRVPWSCFDLINAYNRWKRSPLSRSRRRSKRRRAFSREARLKKSGRLPPDRNLHTLCEAPRCRT